MIISPHVRVILVMALLLHGCASDPARYTIAKVSPDTRLSQEKAEALFVEKGLLQGTWRNYDKKPVVIKASLPEYPLIARRYNMEGLVECVITIGTEGSVLAVEIQRSPDELLSMEVTKAAMGWRFEPLLKSGVPVVAKIKFQYIYRLSDG